MKKIIVPVDFSEYSEYALETASILAKKHNAELLILHMLELSDTIININSTEVQTQSLFFLELAEKKFESFLEKDYLKEIKYTPIVKHYKVFKEINEIAQEHNADLIVMGSKGASGLKEVFIGSNTEKVIRSANIPVLVVKQNPILTSFDSIVFACDFSEDAILPYRKIKSIASDLGCELNLLYVNTPTASFKNTFEIDKKINGFFNIADSTFDYKKHVHFIDDYSVEEGILNFANFFGADLITVVTKGKKGLSHFFEGSISEDVANHSTLPVLTIKM